ncbi:MAG: KOW motif-containing protein, partial [Bacteroidota bacterium]
MERKSNSQPKLKIKKGDTVKVISGESKGQQGKVLEVMLESRKVIVERVN